MRFIETRAFAECNCPFICWVRGRQACEEDNYRWWAQVEPSKTAIASWAYYVGMAWGMTCKTTLAAAQPRNNNGLSSSLKKKIVETARSRRRDRQDEWTREKVPRGEKCQRAKKKNDIQKNNSEMSTMEYVTGSRLTEHYYVRYTYYS